MLTVPLCAFVVFCALRFAPKQWPAWSTNLLLAWFVANFIVLYLVARRFAGKQAPPTDTAQMQTQKVTAGTWLARAVGSYLVVVWGVLFLRGLKGTMSGEYQLSRAIPAGAFLLFFILLFGWATYRSFRPKSKV